MRAAEQSVRLERISQERFIQAPIDTVYDYVTQPDRWHEWHPTSLVPTPAPPVHSPPAPASPK